MGFLAFAGSLAWALLARGRETGEIEEETLSLLAERSRLEGSRQALENEVAAWRRRLDTARLDSSGVESEIWSLLGSDPRLVAGEEGVLEELNGRIAALEAEIDAAARSAAASAQPAAPPAPARPEGTPPTAVRKPASSPGSLDRHLKRFQDSVVLVVSSGPRLASGLVVGQRAEAVYVMTISDAISPGAGASCLFRSAPGSEDRFQAAPAGVVYRDSRSPFLILEATGAGPAAFGQLAEGSFDGSIPGKGDTVYAIGAHAVGATAFTGSVFEGIVSSLEQAAAGGHDLFETTLPVNEGSPGSLVVTNDGKVAGVLWKRAGNLDRVSMVLAAGSAKPLLERLGRRILAEKAGGPAEPVGDYPMESFAELEEPLSLEAEVFGGPDDLAIIWEASAGRLRALRPGKASPAWQISRGSWSSLTYRPWQSHAFLTSAKTRAGVAVNLRTGKAAARLPDQITFPMSRAWAAFPFGSSHVLALPTGLAIAHLESGRVLEMRNVQVTLMAHVDDIITLSTHDGNVGWLTRSEFLAILVQIEALYQEISAILRDKPPGSARDAEVSRRNTEVGLLFQQIGRGIKTFTVPGGLGRDGLRPGSSFCHVPGSYLHIIGRSVWQIGPDQVVRKGSLEPLWHSGGGEDWSRIGQSAGAQPCATASPDGRHAVTATHIHDPHTLQAVAELPFPSGPAGFLSKGEKLYAYDRSLRRLVFLRLADILERGAE